MGSTPQRIAVAVLGLLWLAPAALWLRVLARRRVELDGAGLAQVLVRGCGNLVVAALMIAGAATRIAWLLGAAAVLLLVQFPLLWWLRRRG